MGKSLGKLLLGLTLIGWGVGGATVVWAADPNEIGPVPAIPQGVAIGDVDAGSAVLWTRLPGGSGRLELAAEGGPQRTIALRAAAADDFTVHLPLTGLEANRLYRYRVVAGEPGGPDQGEWAGSFRTAPAADQSRPLSFVFSGDLGGQGFCRHPETGYGIFRAMAKLQPDFFLANGDMIYADNVCPAKNPDGFPNLVGAFPDVASPAVDWTQAAATFEVFAGHWRYNRADGAFQDFLAHVPIFAQWDDHEVINDFGARWQEWPIDPRRKGYPQLVAEGVRAFFLHNPISRHPEEPHRIYRSFVWGRDLEFWILDARSYRSANDLTDRPSNAKELLGATQMSWLLSGIAASKATWKVISNDVPLSVPTGGNPHIYGRDAYANGNAPDFSAGSGFESEMMRLLKMLDANNIENVVFVTTDVHFAMVLRYALDLDGDGDLLHFHEMIAGPLSAYRTPTPFQLDATLKPTILFGRGDFDNFLHVAIEPRPTGGSVLRAALYDRFGKIQEGSRLELLPEAPPTASPER